MNGDVKRFNEGIAEFNVVFTQLVPGTKRTTRTWDYFEDLHAQRGESRIDLVDTWLRKGYGVGYLLRNRLAVIDADKPETIQRVLDFEEREVYLSFPKVHTPSGGIHALLLHPDWIDFHLMKNHVCHPKEDGQIVPWDFKLGERTMLVAPGTVNAKGLYTPGIWFRPPMIDVRSLAPDLEIYRDIKDFVRDTRPKQSRIIAAMAYLRAKAPISIEGKNGHHALRTVAQHIVGYYDLDPSLAFYLMTETKFGVRPDGTRVEYKAWNERCLNQDGKAFPWSDEELARALEDAVDAAPAYGIHLLEKAQEKEFARWNAAAFIEMLTYLPRSLKPIWIKPDALYRVFIEFSGVNPAAFDRSEFGLEVSRAIEQGRLPFIERRRTNAEGRIYLGLNHDTLRIAIDVYEQRQKVFAAVV
jgi:hypothetical protein